MTKRLIKTTAFPVYYIIALALFAGCQDAGTVSSSSSSFELGDITFSTM